MEYKRTEIYQYCDHEAYQVIDKDSGVQRRIYTHMKDALSWLDRNCIIVKVNTIQRFLLVLPHRICGLCHEKKNNLEKPYDSSVSEYHNRLNEKRFCSQECHEEAIRRDQIRESNNRDRMA